ncbi:two component transcriptional regulator, LuxR family [Oryzisolibacter propanilivorax]|uniref:Two component transcriptional regulator, LuxR family n=1 Tax=Oryzisolibacter propanilivorax TaxID=1527607 RepID=A0A1G9SBM0_9BURK|nr:response regulator transcription factor [Oryzisolibacter propanilivorax]SDM32740.1 two component transcriptional regulator, LuxR family [Oryzisolibacter propanilivorax]
MPPASATPAAAPVTTLFLIDDHTLLRRGLVALLSQHEDLQVVGEAGDAGEALRLLPQLVPQVILLDNHLPGVLGVDAIADLRRASPGSRVVMLTVSEDGADLAAALRHGAQGYLLKTIDGDLLAEAVRRAARGEPVVSPEMMGKLVAAFQAQGVPEAPVSAVAAAPEEGGTPLSPREEEVLREIARGASNKEIARALDIAETTVKIHVQHILRKLGLTSRVQAAVYASDRQRPE